MRNNMYICISKGKGITSWVIRFFLTMLIRREEMQNNNVFWLNVPFLMLLSFLNLTKYSKLKARFNHSFLMYYSKDFNEWLAIDIINKGIVIVPLKKAFDRCSFISVVSCNFNIWLGIEKSVKYFGEDYDWRGVFSAVFAILLYVFLGIKLKKINNSPKRFVCSEFVSTVINNSDINNPIGEPIEIHPNLLYVLTKDNKNFKTLIEGKNLKTYDIILAVAKNNQE